MKIFHIMPGKGNGGAETYAADMMLGLRELGVAQQAVLHPRQIRLAEVVAAGIPVLPETLRWPVGLVQRAMIKRAIAAFQPDLVHCWMRRAASVVPALPLPVVGWFGGYYETWNFARCSHFIGVTPDIVAHQRAQGIAPDRSYFIPTFPMTQAAGLVSRATLETPLEATVLLSLSRLHPKKGLDTLLQALQDLPGCVLWLAGDGPLQGTLEAQADRLQVRDRVRFLGWRDDRGALLQAADICVLPSRYEPFGTVMLEAWASSRPLVAAAAAGPAAFIRHEENGMLVPVNDAPALAAAIRQVQNDAVLRQTIVNGGQASYQAQFTRQAVVQQMLALYQQIIADGR